MTYRHGSADLDSGDDGHISHFGSPISSAPGSARWAIPILTYAIKTTSSSPSALSPGHYCPSLCPLIRLFPTPAARYRQGSYKDPGSARSYGTPRDGRRSTQATPRTPGESLGLCGKAHIFPLSSISLIYLRACSMFRASLTNPSRQVALPALHGVRNPARRGERTLLCLLGTMTSQSKHPCRRTWTMPRYALAT
jgi:hypothetical protein